MNTKKLFMLLAAVLLSSVSAFAQSGNNEPLKGDVNEDGTVDVADITAVIKIMRDGGGTAEQPKNYWYVGTTKPTSLTQATIVEEYESPYTFTNPSTTKCDVYVLTKADKDVIFKDAAISYGEFSKIEDITTIPGYKISSTVGRIARGSSVLINVLDDGWKHFYVGTTKPTAENYKTLTPQYSSLSDMYGATVHVPSSGKIYVMLPYQDSPDRSQIKRAFTDNEGNVVTCIERTGDELTIPFHMIWELTFEQGTTLTFQEPTLYFSVGTTAPTASNYTTVNDATTTIPTTTTYSSTQRNYHYILIPSNKTITIVDVNFNNAPINITEQTSIIIPNHKVYKTVGALSVGGTVRITLE